MGTALLTARAVFADEIVAAKALDAIRREHDAIHRARNAWEDWRSSAHSGSDEAIADFWIQAAADFPELITFLRIREPARLRAATWAPRVLPGDNPHQLTGVLSWASVADARHCWTRDDRTVVFRGEVWHMAERFALAAWLVARHGAQKAEVVTAGDPIVVATPAPGRDVTITYITTATYVPAPPADPEAGEPAKRDAAPPAWVAALAEEIRAAGVGVDDAHAANRIRGLVNRTLPQHDRARYYAAILVELPGHWDEDQARRSLDAGLGRLNNNVLTARAVCETTGLPALRRARATPLGAVPVLVQHFHRGASGPLETIGVVRTAVGLLPIIEQWLGDASRPVQLEVAAFALINDRAYAAIRTRDDAGEDSFAVRLIAHDEAAIAWARAHVAADAEAEAEAEAEIPTAP